MVRMLMSGLPWLAFGIEAILGMNVDDRTPLPKAITLRYSSNDRSRGAKMLLEVGFLGNVGPTVTGFAQTGVE